MNLVIKRKKTHLLYIAFGLIAFIGIQAQDTIGGRIDFLVLTFGAIFLIGTDIYAVKKHGEKVMEVKNENLIYTNIETSKVEKVPLNKILGFSHKKQTRFGAGFFGIIVDSSVNVAGQKIAYPNSESVKQNIKNG